MTFKEKNVCLKYGNYLRLRFYFSIFLKIFGKYFLTKFLEIQNGYPFLLPFFLNMPVTVTVTFA